MGVAVGVATHRMGGGGAGFVCCIELVYQSSNEGSLSLGVPDGHHSRVIGLERGREGGEREGEREGEGRERGEGRATAHNNYYNYYRWHIRKNS